jgi:aryl-alcohol dehydrogenase-like predicted oxidoreductase
MTFGSAGYLEHAGHADLDEAKRQIALAADHGVNLVDTADMYSTGASEEIIGEILHGRREDFLVATKVRFAMGPRQNDVGLSRHHIVRACEASLRRLRTDCIDLYQLHEWDGATPLEETVSALESLLLAGKVRYVGASNFTAWQFERLAAVASERGVQIASNQIYYSLQDRTAEFGMLQANLHRGAGTIVYSGLAGGLLTGRYRRGSVPEDGRHATSWDEPPVHDWDHVYRIVDELVAVAEARDVPPAQVALAWLISRPGVSSAIVGARTTSQLAQTLVASELDLHEAELGRLEAVSRLPLPYPLWHQVKLGSDRMSALDSLVLRDYLS